MSMDDLELEKSQVFNWWKTEYKVSGWDTIDLLEKLIKNNGPVISNIIDDLKILPPELRLIRIIFDMKCNFHYLLHDERDIYHVYQIMPNMGSYNIYEDEDKDEE